jgi:hypothetical protein
MSKIVETTNDIIEFAADRATMFNFFNDLIKTLSTANNAAEAELAMIPNKKAVGETISWGEDY